MTKEYHYPGIPEPTSENIVDVVRALKESIEIGQRIRSVEGDSFTRYSELQTLDTWVRTLRWDDLRFPASSAGGQGTAPPTFNTTYGTWYFTNSANRTLFFTAQLPHAWAEGTTLHPHVHWAKTTTGTTGNVVWKLDYEIWKIRKQVSSTTTLYSREVVDGTPDNDIANQHLISAFDRIGVQDVQISDMLTIRLTRDTTDSEDTYGANAQLLEFDIHYQSDQVGSVHEFIKTTDI